MARKGENIRKRKDGRWEGRVTVKDENGEKKIYSLYDTSYQKVKEKVFDARKKLLISSTVLLSENLTELKQIKTPDISWDILAKEWLENIRESKKQSTFIKYRNVYQNYIEKFFRTYPLDKKIELFMVEDIFEEYVDYSDSLRKSIRSVLKSVFSYAADEYKLSVPDLKKGEYRKENHSIKVLSELEQIRLSSYLMKNMDNRLLGILICITTGIRLGEICSLKWSDIDFNAGILHISTTVQRIAVEDADVRTRLVETRPKTSCSERDIPLPDILMDLLKRYYARSTYVINNDMPMEPRTYQYIWRQCQKTLGIRYKNFHCLRHTFATNCIAQGIDVKSLSEILGHSDVKTTMNRYVHPSIATKRSHINAVCVCFFNAKLSSAIPIKGHK